jgi:hypothetical protein
MSYPVLLHGPVSYVVKKGIIVDAVGMQKSEVLTIYLDPESPHVPFVTPNRWVFA